MGPYKSTSRWDWYSWGPLLIGGGVVGRCCRVAEWPASVGWRFSDIGNWFPDIGKSSTFPDIGKSISDIRKSFPDIGKSIISRYRKLISRYREFQFPISGNNSRYLEMLNKKPKWLSALSRHVRRFWSFTKIEWWERYAMHALQNRPFLQFPLHWYSKYHYLSIIITQYFIKLSKHVAKPIGLLLPVIW